jgi:hypothetical protein
MPTFKNPANESRLNKFLKYFGFPLLGPESNFEALKLFDIQEKVQNQSTLLTQATIFTLVRVVFT